MFDCCGRDRQAATASTTNAGVAKTFTLTVNFSEAMDKAVAPVLTLPAEVASTLALVSGSWNSEGAAYTATYRVADAGVDVRDISVNVSGAVDAAGNTQQNYSAQVDFSIDTTSPTLVSTEPVEAPIAVGGAIQIAFSENIVLGSGQITIRTGAPDGAIAASFDVETGAGLSVSEATLTLDLPANLQGGEHYFVVFESGAIKDEAGNNRAGSSSYGRSPT